MGDDYRARENDDLVEPMFGGLRAAGERSRRERAQTPPARGLVARFFSWLRACFTRRR